MSMQLWDIPAAGRQVNARATFIRYESAGTDAIDQRIKVRANGQDFGYILPGDTLELHEAAERWDLMPMSGSAVVRLGVGRVTSSRTSLSGSVELLDTQRQDTEAGRCFGYMTGGEPTPGAQFFYGLWNPAGSGRDVVIDSLIATISAGTLQLRHVTAEPPAALAGGFNKLLGGAAGVAKVHSSALNPSTYGTQLYTGGGPRIAIDLAKTRPYVLKPGNGLLIGSAASVVSGASFNVGIEWRELP